jgi:hypothetical protein
MLKLYEVMAVTKLIYRSEFSAMSKAEKTATEAAEIKFLQCVTWYTTKDQKCNDNIREKLKILNLNNTIQRNKRTGTNIF